MTTRAARPFLLQFAERISSQPSTLARYDAKAQLGEVLTDGRWLFALDSDQDVHSSTKKTGVGRETTDDD